MLTMVHVILAVTFILMVDPTIISSNGTCSKPIVNRVVVGCTYFYMFIPDAWGNDPSWRLHIFQMAWWKTTQLHPGKLTWNPKMEVWKMIFLFNWVIVRFHVNFQGCSKVWLLKNLNVSGSGNRKKKPSKSSTGGHLISWRRVEHGYRHRMFRTMAGDRDWKVSFVQIGWMVFWLSPGTTFEHLNIPNTKKHAVTIWKKHNILTLEYFFLTVFFKRRFSIRTDRTVGNKHPKLKVKSASCNQLVYL